MAELAVATALTLVQIIIPLLRNLNLHTDVDEEDIQSMSSWLLYLQAVMEDADGRDRSWTQLDLLGKVRKIAYDIEDVLDDFILHSPPYTFHHHNFTRTIHTMAHKFYHRFPHRRLSERIAAIRKHIEEITNQSAISGHISPSGSGGRPSSSLTNGAAASSDLSPNNFSLPHSYTDLSSSLKRCFLYMSIFPEDHSVERGRLIRLWVAECFAVATGDQTAEEVAEGYLNELIQRNLILVSNRDFDGRPRSCRVLHLGHLKFIIQKSKNENFASVFPKENTLQNNRSKMLRRLSVHGHFKNLPGDDDLAGVRSMFLLRLQEGAIDSLDSNFLKILQKLNLIKVVDVQGAPVREFPKEMTRFTLMRYLSFRDTKIKSIPASIEKLSYLETLDLKQTDVTELPQEISNLHNLRHLLAYKYNVTDYEAFDYARGVKLQEGIGKLKNLQKLSLVKIGQKGRILKDLKALTQLRKLGVTSLRREHGKDLCAAVEAMQSIKTLNITSVTEEEFIEVQEMTNPPRKLERLYLKGRLKRIPEWISQLDCLVRIRLKWSKLNESPLRVLGCLPRLIELQMVDCFIGDNFVFEPGCFLKLEILVMEGLSNVNTVKIESGSMAQVRKISLRRCCKLTMLLGVNELVKVEELSLYDMREELLALLSINGNHREYVNNIPLIYAVSTDRDRNWSFRNLSDPISFSS